MRPIWAVCVDSMSYASWCSAGSVVWSRSHAAIWTACSWWTVMSWANPTSTESAAGTAGSDDPGRPMSRPAAAPSSSSATTATTATNGRAQRGSRPPPDPEGGTTVSGSATVGMLLTPPS